MVNNNINRLRRRKLEREAALKDFTALATELNLEMVEVRGLRPEIMYDAVDLITEARAILPSGYPGFVYSTSPETGLYFVVRNAKSQV